MFIDTVPPDAATGAVAERYAADLADQGYVSNDTYVFAPRPEVLDAWLALKSAIQAGLDTRRYELVTFAAARALRSTYCAMAHGRVLRDRFYDTETVHRIATDHADAGLTPAEAAVMDFAERVARDATSVAPDDIGRLRDHGLSDPEILDVVLTAAARCFYSTVLDAVGAQADAPLSADLEPALRAVLTVGRAPQASEEPVGPADRLPATGDGG